MLDLGSCIFPFTLSQVGVGKSILQTLLGFFMFGGVTFHPVNVVGHVMNIMGGIGYTLLKYYSLCVAHALSVLDIQLSCLFQPMSMHTCVHVLKGAIFGGHHMFYFCSVFFLFVSPPCFEYCGAFFCPIVLSHIFHKGTNFRQMEGKKERSIVELEEGGSSTERRKS